MIPALSPVEAPAAEAVDSQPDVIPALAEGAAPATSTQASEPSVPTLDGFVPVTARTGQGLLLIDPQNYRYHVHLPSACLADGEDPSTIVRICVSDAGAVARVDVLRPSVLPYLDSEVPLVIQSWRYAPYLVQAVPTAFCYVLSYRVR